MSLDRVPPLFRPAARGYFRLFNHADKQQELPAASELNYDVPRWVIARPQYRGLNFMAGFDQLGMMQSYHGAYLPPPVRVGPIQKTRSVSGAWGTGIFSTSQVHVPGVLVPPTVG